MEINQKETSAKVYKKVKIQFRIALMTKKDKNNYSIRYKF